MIGMVIGFCSLLVISIVAFITKAALVPLRMTTLEDCPADFLSDMDSLNSSSTWYKEANVQ